MSSKVFSLEEINNMWPLLKSISLDLVATWARITRLKAQQATKEDLDAEVARLNLYIKEVERLGGYIQDIGRAVLLFQTLCNSVRVFTCLEPLQHHKATYFHDLDGSYEDRQLISHHWCSFLRKRVAKQED